MRSDLLRRVRESHPDRGGSSELLQEAVSKLRETSAAPTTQTVRVEVPEAVATFGGYVEVQGVCDRCICTVCRGKQHWAWQKTGGRLVRAKVECPGCVGRGVVGVCCSRVVPLASCLCGQVIYDDGFLRAEAVVERKETRERDAFIEADICVDWLDIIMERPVSVSLLGRSAIVNFSWFQRTTTVAALEGVRLCAHIVEPSHDPRPLLLEYFKSF